MPFSVATYNVLADAYARPERYQRGPASALARHQRLPRLVHRILALDADIVCLQEVEPDLCQALHERHDQTSHVIQFAGKTGNKPDGCATIIRTPSLRFHGSQTLYFADGNNQLTDSGHLALITVVEQSENVLAIANTHLKWDPPDTPLEAQWAHRQISQLLRSRKRMVSDVAAWVICGDFNAEPNSAVVRTVRKDGFRDAFDGQTTLNTCVANGKARKVDYLFHSITLAARPVALAELDDESVMPSKEEPSDHLPLKADFDWQLPSGPS